MDTHDVVIVSAVEQAISTLARQTDLGTVDDYLRCFSPDALVEMKGRALLRGVEEIKANCHERRFAGAVGPGSQTRHFVSNVCVTPEGDHAKASCYWQFVRSTDSEVKIAAVGTYSDEFRLMGDRWVLDSRLIVFGA